MTNQQNAHQHGGMTKRNFLQSLGMVGGTAAMMTALQGWDMGMASSLTEPPKLNANGNGKKLIILGSGLAGMITAIEMTQKGYDCQIIEARERTGGRCVSARKGTVVHELGGERQVCDFDHGQYLNIGPWRIAAEHYSTRYYCKKYGVKLEPMLNDSPHAYFYSENASGPLGSKRLRQGELNADRHGYIHELLAKTAAGNGLDDLMSKEDQEQLLEHLFACNLINKRTLEYGPSRARGHSDYPGVGLDNGKLSDPYNMNDVYKVLIGARYHTADHPAIMLQAAGGMDQIAQALARNVPKGISTFNAEVTDIIQHDDRVDVTYKDTNSGDVTTVTGDYCITTIPFTVLPTINNNFDPEMLDAIKSPSAAPAFKLGLQMKDRFWEDDMIIGGASYSDIPGHRITSYPSSDLYGANGGVLLAAYGFGRDAIRSSNLSIEERKELGLMVGEKLHPGEFRKNYNGKSISISWHKEKYSLAGWVRWSARGRTNKLPKLIGGDKRVFFSGNGMSGLLDGWMAGAIEGAWLTMAELDKRVGKA